jgi:hypothetical protein
MDDWTSVDADPRASIERLEERIEQLSAKIESCRKFRLVARIAIAGGGVLLVALMVRALAFDPAVMGAGIAALLCGIVLLGSNRSTEDEASAQRAAAEAERAALIGGIELRVVGGRDTLH